MNIQSKLSVTLLCTASVLALSPLAHAQEAAGPETIIVTGSRIISDAANSPTPLTVVSTAQLEATTPSDIPDALNKLPIFQGSTTPRSIDNASTNSGQNILNLRNFGGQRTLILMDGHRVAPSNANGTVDADSLPSMLVSRVDVVTGGASAVYGSDAVTGVVNYILDKHFNGIKVEADSGISTYSDGAQYKAGIAAGTDLFGGRAHIEASARHFHQDGVAMTARRQGRESWQITGTGSAANPYTSTEYADRSGFAYGGYIACTGTTANPCVANGQQFLDGGVIAPWNPGSTTGTAGINSGGDGVTTNISHITSALTTDEAFARFSYNLDDTTTAYLQFSGTQADDKAIWQNSYLKGGNCACTFFKSNPYLTADAKAKLAGGTATSFTLTEWFINQGPQGGFMTNGLDTALSLNAGVDGTLLGKYDWDVYYTHGASRQKVDDPRNINNQLMYASEDAVTNAAGNVICYASTQAATAAAYANCVPMNPFGPNALTSSAYKYWVGDTNFVQTYDLDDVGGSIAGDIFDLPAGPVKAALSGEMRWLSFEVDSNATPNLVIDCTGLRICNSTTAYWQGNTINTTPKVSENVWEFAGEVEVPLLKDAPLIQSLSANLAGRYTDYSTSGAVETWKIGLDYHVNDDIRFRATNSVDIRAPTLSDLFSPVQAGHSTYNDIHTQSSTTLLVISQGNANLVPEVARTYTAGIVLTPSFIPGLTASVDYYNIKMKNAIGSISGNTNATQNLCEASGGNSPYCALYVRPLPFSNTTSANLPTAVLSESLNTALNEIEGVDMEMDYGFEMSSLWDTAPGTVNLRVLATMQDVNESQTYPGGPLQFSVNPKGVVTSFVGYRVGNWSLNLEDRWLSGAPKSSQYGLVFVVPRAPSRNYIDFTVNKKFNIDDQAVEAYLSVQNLFDQQPPINPTVSASPGLYYEGSTSSTYDAIGRYFTIGVRANL